MTIGPAFAELGIKGNEDTGMTDQSENPTNGPANPQSGPGSLAPGSLESKISLATYARDFFNALADRSEMAALIASPMTPTSSAHGRSESVHPEPR